MSIFRITLTGFLFGQTIQNVLHFDNVDGALTEAQAATEMSTQWLQQIKTIQITSFTWSLINVQNVSTLPRPSAYNLPVNIAGTQAASNPITVFLAHVIRLRTGLSGRKGRGRIYIAGPSSGEMANGILTAASIAKWETILNVLRGRYLINGSTQLRLGVFHRAELGGTITACSEMTVAPVPGVQRRRNVGVGV